MSDESHKTKDRSPNFPFITLEVALQRAHQFFSKEKRGAAPYRAAALHWNYSESSSGGMQTVAALKNYGLMSDEGSGAQRMLKLTELALRIILDQRPGSMERLDYIREAAAFPAVTQEIYGKWGFDLPSEATLLHYLVLERSFNNSSVHKVARIIYANHEFAKFDASSILLVAADKNEDENLMEPTRGTPMSPGSASSVMRDATSGLFKPSTSSATESERVIAPDASVLLEFSAHPTWETYDFLENYMRLRKSVLKKKNGERINVNEEYEVRYWAKKFGVDEQRLREVVREVGAFAEDVELQLLG